MTTKNYADYTFGDIMALDEQEYYDYQIWLSDEWIDRHLDEIEVPKVRHTLTGRIAGLKAAGKYIIDSMKGEKLMKSVFELEYYTRVSEPYRNQKGRIRYQIPAFPHNLDRRTIGHFSSLEQAEEVMRTDAREHWGAIFASDEYCGHFCYAINEYRLDESECWMQPESRRTYLTDGSLNDESLTCERGNCAMDYRTGEYEGQRISIGKFIGRQPEKIRFKEGQIVEIMDDMRVVLGVIVALPPTVDFVKKNLLYFDYSEDSYTVAVFKSDAYQQGPCGGIPGKSLRHYPKIEDSPCEYDYAQCCFVFPLRLPIDKEKQEQLIKADCEYIKKVVFPCLTEEDWKIIDGGICTSLFSDWKDFLEFLEQKK
ncbi:MAG: hypothetical protein LBS43_06665 [Prevotellaceae bacterium]|jgi:hypothetical protein|nr:hypothetical protein [Prevotellaceae bacterium]